MATTRGRTLIRGGVVLTLDPAVGDFDTADVLIEGDKIAAVEPSITADAHVIDASRMIVMPGFIDTHHHHYHEVLRNSQPDGTLDEYMRDVMFAAAPQFRPEDAYIGNLSAALRAIDSGTTTVTDTSGVSNSPEHSDALITGLKDAGVRAVYAYSRGSGPEAKFPADLPRIRSEHFSSDDQLVTLALDAFVDADQWRFAREQGLRTYVHAGNGFGPGWAVDDAIKLGEAGLMGPNLVFIHFTRATEAQIRRVKDTGGSLSIAAPVELAMGHGMPPIQQALDAGLRPSLSTDVETSMTADMFTQMRSILTIQRALITERAVAGEEDLPARLTAREVVELATVEGARASALGSEIGTLTPGKQADIILLRADLTNTLPLNDAFGAVVTGMDTRNVDTVIIGGTVRKAGGQLVGVDLGHLWDQAAASRDYLYAKLGWSRSVIGRARARTLLEDAAVAHGTSNLP